MSQDETAVNQEVEAPTPAESAPEETQELEVIREGEAVEPILHEQSEEEGEAEESSEESPEPEAAEEPEDEKPLGEKGMRRNQRLANENRQLKEYIAKLESQPQAEQYDVRKAIEEKGLTPEQARIEALEHDRRVEKQERAAEQASRELQDLNVAVRADAESVVRDFPELTSNEQDTNTLMDAWHQVADVQYLTDDNGETVVAPDGAPVIKNAKFSLYDFANIIDHFAASRQRAGEATGQKAAEKNLAAVEVRPSTKPKQTNTDDSKLSADAYAKKYNLSVAR